jgi:hypothetical protein
MFKGLIDYLCADFLKPSLSNEPGDKSPIKEGNTMASSMWQLKNKLLTHELNGT